MKRNANLIFFLAVLAFGATITPAQKRLPILDMHMHARLADHYGPPPLPICAPVDRMPFWDQSKSFLETLEKFSGCKNPIWSAKTDEEVLRQTVAVMEKYNIIGVLGGKPELVKKWMDAAPGRFIPGLDFRLDRATGTATAVGDGGKFKPMSPGELRELYKKGAFKVFGEVLNQYAGIAPDDARMEPYWALAEELDVPVGIHIGPGGPGEIYLGNTGYRARLQSALTLEEVLVKHPRLRVYIMHAGYPMLDDLLALLFSHPQVYVEISMLANVEPRPAFYRFLKGIVDGGYGERVMFGSDQMVWAGLIEPAIEGVENAAFLTKQQKRDIFYNNAARFLRLSKEEIARHHRMGNVSISETQNLSAEQQVLKLNREYSEMIMRGDAAEIEKVLADDYVVTDESGNVLNKAQDLATYKNRTLKIESVETLAQKAREIGENVFVVNTTVRFRGIKGGKSFDLTEQTTTVWALRGGRWQIVSDHFSLVKKE